MEFSHNEKEFFKQKYYVKDQCVYNKKNQQLFMYKDDDGYIRFGFVIGSRKDNSRKDISVKLHRIIAYQKYGDLIYVKGMQTRHKDNNKLNNDPSNILIGTQSQNMMDLSSDIRLKKSIHATTFKRKFSDLEVEKIRKYHAINRSYKRTMQKFDISSCGSLWYILNKKYKTVKE